MIHLASSPRRDRLIALTLVVAAIALSIYFSHHRILWSDEIFAWMLVTDPSLRHMLHAWNSGADGGGLSFYLLARLWLDLFGRTPAAFRLFSATGIGIAAALTFRIARRFYSCPIALFSVALLWFSSDIVLWQIMQARFYGMLLALVAAAAYLFLLTEASLTPRLLALTCLCHALLVTTHPFGLVYSAVILLVMLASDTLAHRLRPRLYLAALSGWILLLPCLPALRNIAAIGRPHFWTTTPTVASLGDAYSCWSLLVSIVLASIAAIFLALLATRRIELASLRSGFAARRALFLLTAALLFVPLAVFLLSQGATSLFVDRYLIPTVIAMALVCCQLLTSILSAFSTAQSPRGRKLLHLAAVPVTLAILCTALVQFPSHWRLPDRDRSLPLLALLPKDLPVVVQPVELFDQLLSYHRQSGYQFVYLLDWESVTAPESPRGEVPGYHEMENWRKVGYFSGSIQPADRFLAQTPAFVVLDTPASTWFRHRIRPDARFALQPIGAVSTGPGPDDLIRLWLVRRRVPMPQLPPAELLSP